MATPLTDAINALTTYANTVTGASDTTLSDAVGTLAAGYGGGGSVKAVSGSFTLASNFSLTTSSAAFTSVKLPFKPDFFFMALDRDSYDDNTVDSNCIRILVVASKDITLPMRISSNVSTDSVSTDTYMFVAMNTTASTDVASNGTAGNGFTFPSVSYMAKTYFGNDGQLYVSRVSSAASKYAKGTWNYVGMKL